MSKMEGITYWQNNLGKRRTDFGVLPGAKKIMRQKKEQ